jgi:hypothetical protein
VQKDGNQVPPYKETQHYVKVIMANYYKLVEEATAARSAGVAR